MLWVPEGFGHAFLVVSESAEFLYKTTDYYVPDAERCIIWDDPTLAIDWPLVRLNGDAVQLSGKDKQGRRLNDADVYP
jgi:dTDP-4-dehydrorhamnose 3,5-epimerase